MKTTYYHKSKPVAQMNDGILSIIDPKILVENKYKILTTKENEDDHNILLVKHLHDYLSKQHLNKSNNPLNVLGEDEFTNEL